LEAGPVPLAHLGDTHLMAPEAQRHAHEAALRQAVRDGLQDVADENGVVRFRDLMVGDVMATSAPASKLAIAAATEAPEKLTERILEPHRQHARQNPSLKAQQTARSTGTDINMWLSDGLADDFGYRWVTLKVTPLHAVPVSQVQEILAWLTEKPFRLHSVPGPDMQALAQRVNHEAELEAARDHLLEQTWTHPLVFKQAVPLIPGEQVWPWLHRAAQAGELGLMDAIRAGHDRAIGSEPFHALHNAVFNRDTVHMEQLIQAQCRRYGWSTDNLGGERTSPKAKAPSRRPSPRG
jgi:hypothetical protein